jgi:gas vesicle protein
MSNRVERDYLRLTHNEPLVLAVSALSDFLWEDFVRDTQPTVKYLIEQYNIRHLSRFGKEVFDFLYNGGAVTPLISLEDVEQYFRAKQNGQKPDFPTGYKPETAFWLALFAEICNSPAWPRLVSLSCGDQFNAGNNAVNILNELSDVLEAQIEKHDLPIDLVAQGGQKLEELRQAFLDAKEAGDDKKAAEIRQAGKDLGQAIEQAVEQSRKMVQPEISRALDRVEKTANETQEALSNLAGTHAGQGKHSDDLKQKRELAKKLRQNPALKKLIHKLGALRKAWNDRKRAKRAQSSYSDIVGAKFSDELTNAFSSPSSTPKRPSSLRTTRQRSKRSAKVP